MTNNLKNISPKNISPKNISWCNGQMKLCQHRDGFPATTDALLLAGAVPKDTKHALELGAGVGASTLALAARCPEICITAAEIDPEIAEILQHNITQNGLTDRVAAVCCDGLAANPKWSRSHDLVMMNPPYNDAASSLSPDPARRRAMASADLTRWLDAAANALITKGRLVMIVRTDRLSECLDTKKFGDISIKPIYTTPNKDAKRVLISMRKNVRGGVTILPPLVLTAKLGQDFGEINMIPHGRHGRSPKINHIEKPSD